MKKLAVFGAIAAISFTSVVVIFGVNSRVPVTSLGRSLVVWPGQTWWGDRDTQDDLAGNLGRYKNEKPSNLLMIGSLLIMIVNWKVIKGFRLCRMRHVDVVWFQDQSNGCLDRCMNIKAKGKSISG